MHLIDMAMSGLPLPPVLPPDYLPPTFRYGFTYKYESSHCLYYELLLVLNVFAVIVYLRRVRSDSIHLEQKSVQEEMEEEAENSQDKKLPGLILISCTHFLTVYTGTRNQLFII